MRDIEQQFLNELDAQLWKAADKLRSHLDAANYKHVVLIQPIRKNKSLFTGKNQTQPHGSSPP